MILGNIPPQILIQVIRGLILILVIFVLKVQYSRIKEVLKEEKKYKKRKTSLGFNKINL